MTPDSSTATRRYDLDWLRIIAFILLIFYHVGMFYVTWDWHVKSDSASDAIKPLMMLVNPWRLELLFFISGVAARFMIEKTTMAGFAVSRFNRLFWPLLFGVLVIVPPQSYMEIVEQVHFTGSYWDFYGKYLTFYHGWCDQDGCLIVPTWNHLWYIVYLLVYCLLLATLWPVLKRLFAWLSGKVPARLVIALPFVGMWFARCVLQAQFGETHALVDDWYMHANSFGYFLLGAAVARSDRLFAKVEASRWWMLGLGLLAFALLTPFREHMFDSWDKDVRRFVWTGLMSVQTNAIIAALLGFAHRHLIQADGPWRRTLTEAVFPFYIVHQTIIVVAAHYLNTLHMPVAVEAGLLIAITAGGCVLTYVVVRAVPLLRPLFGLHLKDARRSGDTRLERKRESP